MPRILSFLLLAACCPFRLLAQAPEQDCIHAIDIDSPVYTAAMPYTGFGNVSELSPGNQGCLASGEKNDAWYRVIVYSNGKLAMSIVPANATEDFDYAIWNVTGHNNCEALFDYANNQPKTFPPVRCNYSGTPGTQGIDDSITGQLWAPALDVVAGDTLLLNVSSFSLTMGGYTLNFSRSTAAITAPPPPPPVPSGVPVAASAVFSLSPNPARGQLRIHRTGSAAARLRIRSLSGQLVFEGKLKAGEKDSSVNLDPSLPDGTYTAELWQEEGRYFQRIQLMR